MNLPRSTRTSKKDERTQKWKLIRGSSIIKEYVEKVKSIEYTEIEWSGR